MNSKRILLIGGAGFMGRALAASLSSLGHRVDVLVRELTQHFVGNGVVHTGGLENTELVRRILPDYQTVIHLASSTTPGTSSRSPSLESDLNISPTLRFLEILQTHPDVHLIFMSSGGTVYGNPARNPVPEDSTIQPQSYYGAGKAAIELFLNCYRQNFSGRVTTFRPSNLYGPGQPYYVGFGVIRTMLQHVLNGTSIPIWGDGNVVRDFLYVDDLASACAYAVEHPDVAGTYNIGSGVGHSLNQVRDIIESVCQLPLHVEYQPERRIDVQRVVLDTSHIRKKFGWVPRVPLEEGIHRTWQSLKSG